MTDKRYIFVDVCWTLFYSNTTFDFLDFAVRDRRYQRLRRIGRTWIGRKANVLLYKLFGYDRLRTRGLHYLAGKTRTELQALAEQFYSLYLVPRRIEQVWQTLPAEHLVVVSGTLDIIAKTVAEHIGAEAYYATEMLYDGEVFTGKYRDFLLGKADVLPHYNDFDIITDNITDIDLVRHAHHATIVTYNNKSRWAAILPTDINATFIDTEQTKY